MRILFEGEQYSLTLLNSLFDDSKFYSLQGNTGIISSVGYYHSFSKNTLVYMLPKVFVINGKAFGNESTEELSVREINFSFKHDDEFGWARKLSLIFYKSLIEFRKRNEENSIVNKDKNFELSTNLGSKEYSYLDIVLSFMNFYKKNKSVIIFFKKDYTSNHFKKPNWEKTVRQTTPLINNSNVPIYYSVNNRVNTVNVDEQLLFCFFSILNYFKKEHDLAISVDKSYGYCEGAEFERLKKRGLKILKQIKHKYFSDVLKRMYNLCYLYFSQAHNASVKKKNENFISVKNYNIIFEDMVDKLLTEIPQSSFNTREGSLKQLKYNNDGKIIDHIFPYPSLIDENVIFYLGDSKYYKPENRAGNTSIYKQFTYAKNTIQYNINVFNTTGNYYSPQIRYRDELTEGYNITPNFFIFGYISDLKDFANPLISIYGEPKKSQHFKGRLFDRDTLFVLQYQINFLFVLNAYTASNSTIIDEFKLSTKNLFRQNFIDYLNSRSASEYEIYERQFGKDELSKFIEKNFKVLYGKCISVSDHKLLVGKHIDDIQLSELLLDFKLIKLQ
jgi:hypothetical protein